MVIVEEERKIMKLREIIKKREMIRGMEKFKVQIEEKLKKNTFTKKGKRNEDGEDKSNGFCSMVEDIKKIMREDAKAEAKNNQKVYK